MRKGVLFLILSAAVSLYAQEYSLLGSISMEGSYLSTPGGTPENQLDSLFNLEANHRLDYEKFSFTARHKMEMDRLETLDFILDEAYIDYRPADIISLGAGKQRIPWGRGIAFFPTDSLHPSHTRDDTEGFSGLTLVVTPGERLQLTGAVDLSIPLSADAENQDFYKSLKYAFYGTWFLGNADLAFSAVYGENSTLRPGLGISFDLGGFIFTAEGAAEYDNRTEYPDPAAVDFRRDDSSLPRFLAAGGISRSLAPRGLPDVSFLFAGEYLYAGTGYTGSQQERYADIIAAYLSAFPHAGYPENPYPGRHYLFILGSIEVFQHFSLELTELRNLQDRSSLISGNLTLFTVPGMDIRLSGTVLLGDGRTEFGALKAVLGEYSVGLSSEIYF